jgi:WbqC-like protein family
MITENYYFPSIDYFCGIIQLNKIELIATSAYRKQTLFNRTFILGPHKVERLTIPIDHRTKHNAINQVCIDYKEDWVRNHKKTIENCYSKAPFFEFYYPYFEAILNQKPELLFDLNEKILTICLKCLQINVPISRTEATFKEINQLNFKDNRSFSATYDPFPYLQNFGNIFEPNLSIIDLLFMQGPKSKEIILKSKVL